MKTPEPPEDYAGAEEILQYALLRVSADRQWCADWVEECEENLAAAKARFHEAVIAERELERLLHGNALYKKDDPDACIAPVAFYDRTWVPAPMPEEPAALPPAEALEANPDSRGSSEARTDYRDLTEKIMSALDEMLALWPGETDGGKIASHLSEKPGAVYAALKLLADEDRIQYAKRLDKNQTIVLRPGEPMPHQELTKNQQAVLDFLVSIADGDGIARASIRRINQGIGVAKQTAASAIWPLEQKGRLEILDRGSAIEPAAYRIAESYRRTCAKTQTETPCLSESEPGVGRRKIAHAKALLEQGWTLTAAAARVDADLKSLARALGEPVE